MKKILLVISLLGLFSCAPSGEMRPIHQKSDSIFKVLDQYSMNGTFDSQYYTLLKCGDHIVLVVEGTGTSGTVSVAATELE